VPVNSMGSAEHEYEEAAAPRRQGTFRGILSQVAKSLGPYPAPLFGLDDSPRVPAGVDQFGKQIGINKGVRVCEACTCCISTSASHMASTTAGYASDIDKRIELHQTGYGAQYTRLAHRRGVGMQLVRVWPDAGHDVEYTIKHTRAGGPGAFCPLCRSTPLDGP
jgi:hypothetical protein